MNDNNINMQIIYDRVWRIMTDISDEVGEERIGHGYLLKFEGWGGCCVEDAWAKVENEQKKRGIDIDSEMANAERENACYDYAEEQTDKIIEEDWKPNLEEKGYEFIDGGYDNGGLYGRTWAIFKKKVKLS